MCTYRTIGTLLQELWWTVQGFYYTENLNMLSMSKLLDFYICNYDYTHVEVNSIAIDPNFVLIHKIMIFVIYYCV